MTLRLADDESEALELDQLIAQMEQSLACLRTDEAFKEVLAVVDEYRRMARN